MKELENSFTQFLQNGYFALEGNDSIFSKINFFILKILIYLFDIWIFRILINKKWKNNLFFNKKLIFLSSKKIFYFIKIKTK